MESFKNCVLAFTVVLVVVALLWCESLKVGYDTLRQQTREQSSQVENLVKQTVLEVQDSLLNPVFYNIEQAYTHHNSVNAQTSLLKDYAAIPIDELTNVATVCLHDRPSVTLIDIVNSYNKHKEVYNILKTDQDIQAIREKERPSQPEAVPETIYIAINAKPDSI